jgi:hypothetical protein
LSIVLWATIAVLPAAADVAKLIAPDATQGDQFGQAIALDGDILVVGAPGNDDRGSQTGAVYVFRFDGLLFQFEQKLIAADTAAGDEFGFSVDVDPGGPLITVGAPGGEAAYVFRHNGASWIEEAKLTRGSDEPYYGWSVSATSGWILVGQPFDFHSRGTNNGFGSAQLWKHAGGGVWNLEATVDATFSEPLGWTKAFGDAVAVTAPGQCGVDVDEPCVVVGDPLYSTLNTDPDEDRFGSRFHAERHRVGCCVNHTDFYGWAAFKDGYLGSERGAREGDAVDNAFAPALGEVIQLVGAPGRTSTPEAVVVECAPTDHDCTTSTVPGWTLTASNSAADADFGAALSTDGASIAVGAPKDTGGGSAFLYELNGSGTDWPEAAKVVAPDIHGGTRFGEAVAVDGIHFAVGAPDGNALPAFDSGVVYIGDAFIQCLNGSDDDGDGLIDALDPDCEHGWDDTEQGFRTPTEGEIYAIRQSGAPKLVRIDPTTGVQTLLHSGAPFNYLRGLEIDDAGDLWVLDGYSLNPTLYKMDLSGGTGQISAISSGGLLTVPSGLALEPSGNFLVSDWSTTDVIRVTPTGIQSVFRSIAFNGGESRDVEVRREDGAVFTLDEVVFPFSANSWILREYDPSGTFIQWIEFLSETGWFPQRVGVHTGGDLLVSESLSGDVLSYSAGGTPVTGSSDPQISSPQGVAAEPGGTYIVGDVTGVYRIDPTLPAGSNATLISSGQHLATSATDIAVFHRDCQDGVDNDGDGTIDFGGDPGCDDALDRSEVGPPSLLCDNGLDDDGDGHIDAGSDPGCASPFSPIENPQCDDDLDNDGDGGIDTDGNPRDWDCLDVPSHDDESIPAPEPGGVLPLLIGCVLLSKLGARASRSR